jgi:hypothetical protein
MPNLVSGTYKRFRSLLDAVAANHIGSRPSTAGDGRGPDTSGLGPSVGDDTQDVPSAPNVTILGPSVGDDSLPEVPSAPSVTMLGPSVGDDSGPSDARLKEDVRCIGTTVFGLPLYRFKYLGRPETYEGVMAHEVLQVMPGAVSLAADGYYRVNYSALGTSMRRVS